MLSGTLTARFGQIYKDKFASLENQVAQYQFAVRTTACNEIWEALASVAIPFFNKEDGTRLSMDQGVFAEVLRPSLVGEAFGSDDCEDVLAAFTARKSIGSSIVASLPLFSQVVADVRPEKFTSAFDNFSLLHRVLMSFGAGSQIVRKNLENHTNHRIPFENQDENHENHKNHRIP